MRTVASYAPFHPDQEYIGYMLLDLHRFVGSHHVMSILRRHKLLDIDSDEWYSVLPYFAAINEMLYFGSTQTDLVYLGLKQVEDMVVPRDFAQYPVVEKLLLLGDVYRMHTRGTNVGKIWAQVVSHQHVRLHFRVPQPDDVWYGICYGYMRRFAKGAHFTVSYNNRLPRRDLGGEVTVIDITWQK